MCRYGRQEGRGDESVSLGCSKRYALDDPSTDGPPWPFGYGLNGLVTRPQLSRGVSLVVLDRNDTDPRPVARCRHSQIIQRVFDSPMRFAGGPLDREAHETKEVANMARAATRRCPVLQPVSSNR